MTQGKDCSAINITPDNLRKLLESQAHVVVYASAQMGHLQDLAAHAAAYGGHLTVKGAAALQANVLVDLASQGKGHVTFDFTS